MPYPGVDKSTSEEKRVYHAYYQWVCFVLFFQALFFYMPRFIWKAVEGGKTQILVDGLKSPFQNNDNKIAMVAHYIRTMENQNNRLFYAYFLTEVLNLVNVIVQMVVMNIFLGGEFTNYGWEVINFTEWDWNVRYDPMVNCCARGNIVQATNLSFIPRSKCSLA